MNNRKARLARAARESCTPDGENMIDKLYLPRYSPAISGEHNTIMGFYESPESNNGEDFYGALAGPRRGNKSARFSTPINSRSSAEDLHGMSTSDFDFSDHTRVTPSSRHSATVRFGKCEVGQFVPLRNDDGDEIAYGIVFQVEGIWHGRKLDEQGLCVVEIKKLNVERWARLPHPLDISGNTFEEAEALNGKMIVAWDTHKILLMTSNVQE